MTTATLLKKPHAVNMGRNKMTCKDQFCKIIIQPDDLGQARNYHPDGESVERPRVFAMQLSRARRQILAFRVHGSIDFWPLIPAEVFNDE